MQYTQLGRTGLRVSRLCLGTMNFGRHTSEPESFAIMDRALERGVNFFDTANVYGPKQGEGITEQIIGRWFRQGGLCVRGLLAQCGWRFHHAGARPGHDAEKWFEASACLLPGGQHCHGRWLESTRRERAGLSKHPVQQQLVHRGTQ